MICPKCGNEFTNRSYSELCPQCDCGLSGCQITSPLSAPGGGLVGQMSQFEEMIRRDERNNTLDAVENDLSKLVTYNSGTIACIIKSLRGKS